ncbi:hypothetical protein [Coraliomargarita parva]|uniref:hypothetical protein n=1 Tax=Coraliomargarita parva TaxID=3014050 RepID=UPI0022B32B5A|nr:hypothetical protein [Coraliomargarita parva]
MKFIEKLFTSERGSSLHGALEQTEREAIVDLLIMAVYVDSHLSLRESHEFDGLTDSLGWESGTAVDFYACNATNRVYGALSCEDSTREFVDFAAQRLKSKASRERALELLNKLFQSDGKTEAEAKFFKRVEASLN